MHRAVRATLTVGPARALRGCMLGKGCVSASCPVHNLPYLLRADAVLAGEVAGDGHSRATQPNQQVSQRGCQYGVIPTLPVALQQQANGGHRVA
jgi:hypothetical protein